MTDLHTSVTTAHLRIGEKDQETYRQGGHIPKFLDQKQSFSTIATQQVQ